jgi:hypothetical protein
MRLAENESRLVGMKFEALVELSQERSTLKGIYDDAGIETRCNETQSCNYYL